MVKKVSHTKIKYTLGEPSQFEEYVFVLYDPNSGKLLKRLGEFTNTFRYVEATVCRWCLYNSASQKVRELVAQKPKLLEKLSPGTYPLIHIRNINSPSSIPSLEEQLKDPEQKVIIERLPIGDIVERDGIHYLLRSY